MGSRGSVRALVFLTLAVGLGSIALVALFQLITSYQDKLEEAKRPEDAVMVIVAARDLYQGVSVTEADLYAVQIPPKYLPEGVFLSPEHVVGRIPRERILANEFVRAARLSDPESGVGLNAVIPRGLRAISVDLDDGAMLSGYLQPTNYVDVLVTITPDDPDGVPTTRTVLQAVFVLGVNGRMGQETADEATEVRGRHKSSVTLLVDAEMAEAIAFAKEEGEITLLLRNDTDMAMNQLDGTVLDDLRSVLSKQPEVIRPPVIRKKCSDLKLIRGPTTEFQQFDESGEACE